MTMAKFSTILLLLAVVLVCNVVVGELAGSPQRRRAAVGDRNSTAPSMAPTFVYVDGDGEVASKSDKSKSKGSSKGSKGAKASKSEKYSKKIKALASHVDEVKEESESKSKGSGKSSKSVKSVGGKSDKSAKSDKSKKSAKGATPIPEDSISSKSSVYAITYSPTEEIPSPKDLEELTKMTEKYLEGFMMDFFEKTALTDLDAFLTVMVRDIFVLGQPVIAEFQSNGLFDADSIFIPVTRELDNLIEDAVAQNEYMELLNDLPKSNPFRGTKTIGFTESDSDSPEDAFASGDSSSFVKAGVAAAAAGVVVLAAGLAMLKRRRPSFDDEDMQSLSPKSGSEDVTIAGETASMGVEDASTHFSHWRKNRSLGGEFHDEPLDN